MVYDVTSQAWPSGQRARSFVTTPPAIVEPQSTAKVVAKRSSQDVIFQLPTLTVGGALFGAIAILGFMLRIWDVGARPMHLDESTVAWFGWQLLTGHGYAYDPVYHGPFQHEMLALVFMLFGASQVSARLLAVVFGTGIVILPWFIRDYLGRLAALMSCFLLAVSPSFVYFGRFERDDTYMEFFTFLMVVLVMRFIRDRKAWQLYAASISFALAFATKESIYIVVFIFGSFGLLYLLGSVLRRNDVVPRWFLTGTGGLSTPVLAVLGLTFLIALLATPFSGNPVAVLAVTALILSLAVVALSSGRAMGRLNSLGPIIREHWVNAVTIVVAILALLYSTFGTNLNGLWDQGHAFLNTNHACQYTLAFNLNPCRRDIVGGLFYWLSQHKVARGGQPWYYYLLLFGLYEQLAILFATLATLRALVSRTMSLSARTTRLFFVYWAILALGIYSWAGEKFPWLGIHPLLPITILAALGITDLVRDKRNVVQARIALVAACILVIAELHNTYVLNYVDGANPVEMMVYVQSSPDTLADSTTIDRLSNKSTNGSTLAVTIDSADSWPFAWYLRNMTNAAFPAGAQAVKPPYVNNPIIILDQTDASTLGLPPSLKTGYQRKLRKLNWWFPEDYKQWTWSNVGRRILDGNSWKAIWDWQLYRTAFGPRASTNYYLYVKKRYFPIL